MGIVFFVPISAGWALLCLVVVAIHRGAAGMARPFPGLLRPLVYLTAWPLLCYVLPGLLGMAIIILARLSLGVPVWDGLP